MKKGSLASDRSHACCAPRIKWAEHLVRFLRDLYYHKDWKYEESGPIELLENARIPYEAVRHDELDRVIWFWSRRPRALSVVAWSSWIIAATTGTFSLVDAALNVPAMIASLALVLHSIVRSVRWRRDYESSVDRLVRTSGNGRAAFDGTVAL
jgi:hypothetical protein